MKIVHKGKSNGKLPEIHKCLGFKKKFVWSTNCTCYEILDIRGGTVMYCPECSLQHKPGEVRKEINKIWPPLKK